MKLLEASGGRIVLKKPDGTIALDTDERMFIATDFKSGTVTRPARSVSYFDSGFQVGDSPIDVVEVINLGSINANANAVVGAFKVTGTAATPGSAAKAQAGNGVLNFGWFAAGGTYIHSALPRWFFTGTRWITAPGGLYSTYTFLANAGQLQLREHTQGSAGRIQGATGSINLSQGAITIEYKLYVGTYV